MKRSFQFSFVGIWLIVHWLPAFGEPVEPEPAELGFAELEPLVVYGNRIIAEDLIQTPGSHTIISLDELQSIPAGSIANLLESRAGLPLASFFGDPGLGSPIIRGFGENASSRTLILLDGIPVTSPDLSANPWFQFPVSSLSQVAVLRGSRTVRYGSGALGGVISLETRNPSNDELSGSFEVLLGGFNSETYRGHLSVPLGGWNLGLHADRNLSDGYRQNSAFDSTAWSAVLQSPESEHFEGRWFLSGNELEFENPGSLSRSQFRDDPRQSINTRFNIGDQFVNENNSFRAAQKLSWTSHEERKFTLNTSWRHRERESNFGAGSHSDQEVDTLFLEAVYTDQKGPFSWELGLRGQRDDLSNIRFAELERERTIGEAELERSSIGGFALGRYQVNEQVALTAGIGWDRWSLSADSSDFLFPNDPDLNFSESRSGEGFAAEFSLEYEVNEEWKTWLRYDRIYRFPILDEIAAFQGFILAEPFNADLDAERGHAIEFGWEYEASSWRYEGAFFGQWLEGEIGFDFRENLNVNFADTQRVGLENRLSWQSEHWSASLNHSLTYARYRSGEFRGRDVPLVPRHIFSSRLDWEPSEALSFSIEALGVSRSPEGNDFANQNQQIASRVLYNASASWDLRENLQLSLRAENLLDEDYAPLQFQGQFFPGNGRKLTFGVKLTF